jgi:voltage-gated sodium channel
LIFENINFAFTLIYTIEAIIKLYVFRRTYFRDGWNIFDLIIVISAWIGFIIEKLFLIKIGEIVTIFRTFRISRIFKMVKKWRSLRKIFNTFVNSIPQLANVVALLFIIIYLYGVLGVFFFAQVELQGSLSEYANF